MPILREELGLNQHHPMRIARRHHGAGVIHEHPSSVAHGATRIER